MKSAAITTLLASALPLLAQAQMSEDISPKQLEFFEKEVRPVLVEHCYKCHSKDGDKIKGGLLLDTRIGSRSGGDTGPAVVPHDLDESLLYVAVTYDDSSMEMPPKYKLKDREIAVLKQWIEMGAPDPREVAKDGNSPQDYTNTINIEEGRNHWSYQVPMKPAAAIEEGNNWARNSVDVLIQAGHAENDLTPAPDADPRTLLRRLSFDLTGLPPASDEVEAFVSAYEMNPDKAVSETVDNFLSSPQFGERFGRRWMDVARFAESAGKEINAAFPHAWRYRDYVIDSYNSDKPFDEFITEQLAGDLLEPADEFDKAENLVATGFLAIGTKGLNEISNRQFRFDLVDEQIDTTTQAFLATTVACARCHDHKSDAIPMSDYYAMAGIFLSSETLYGTQRALQNRKETELIRLPSVIDGGENRSLGEMIDLEFRRQSAMEQLQELTAASAQARRDGDPEEATRIRPQILGVNSRIGALDRALGNYDDTGKAHALAMGVRDREEPFDSQVLIRGEEDNPTDERVPRGFIQVIKTHDEEPIASDESGRLQMAHWITSPENPLTARVYANRVWSWLFGEGIVTSVDNFGTTGEAPSHPDLLDYLAVRLHENDWSTKELVREIVTSRTYRMSSVFREDHFQKDPYNSYLWRANKRRLDAESIRDATLAVSGELKLERPVGSAVSEQGDGIVGRGNFPQAVLSRETDNRSVYLPIVRGVIPESLALFDFADPSLIAGKRDVTTVPSQALYMMNSAFVLKSASAMADHLVNDLKLKGAPLAREAFYRCYSRPPTAEEGQKTYNYVLNFIKAAQDSGHSRDEARLMALTTFCQSLIASAEFRYLN